MDLESINMEGLPESSSKNNIILVAHRHQQQNTASATALPVPVSLVNGQNVQILRTVSVGPSLLQPNKKLVLSTVPIKHLTKPSSSSLAMIPMLKTRLPSTPGRTYARKPKPNAPQTDPLSIEKPRFKGPPAVIEPPPMKLIPKKFTPCLRLVDLDVLAQCLWCDTCQQPLSLKNCKKDQLSAFNSFLHVQCFKCQSVYKIPLMRKTDEENFDAYVSDVTSSSSTIKSMTEMCGHLSQQLDAFKNLIPVVTQSTNVIRKINLNN